VARCQDGLIYQPLEVAVLDATIRHATGPIRSTLDVFDRNTSPGRARNIHAGRLAFANKSSFI